MPRNNFYFLFAGLLVLMVAHPLLTSADHSGALIQLAFSALLVVGVFSFAADRRVFRLGLGLAGVDLAASVGYLLTGSGALHVLDLAALVGFCALAIGVAMRGVLFGPGDVTLHRVVGALCIYLLIGVIWSGLFRLVELAWPGAFGPGEVPGDGAGHYLYFSFVTLTTLGYGDVTPLHPVARALAFLEAVTGQLYLAVLIAGLVGRHAARWAPSDRA